MLTIFVDADGCAVKDEVYRVARRYQLAVRVVSNNYMRVPNARRLEQIVVGADFDAADDWIAERAGEGDIVVTADIPLAARCLKNAARVLGPKGREFKEESIGNALANRELNDQLRQMGVMTGGPAPMPAADPSCRGAGGHCAGLGDR